MTTCPTCGQPSLADSGGTQTPEARQEDGEIEARLKQFSRELNAAWDQAVAEILGCGCADDSVTAGT